MFRAADLNGGGGGLSRTAVPPNERQEYTLAKVRIDRL
jgi:hypothetical protein